MVMQASIARWPIAIVVALVLHVGAAADETQPSDTADHIAIQGYDVVSYFTDGKPVKGNPAHEVAFDDSKWWFKDVAHKEMFTADPERYLPQYGGFCAGGMAMGVSVPANPDNWVIVDGKLYMVSGGKADLGEWKAHAAENIKAANKVWAEHASKAAN
jgi:hypothetical protein